jgi:hypothetical protein
MIFGNNFHKGLWYGLWGSVNIALQFPFCSEHASYFHRFY